MSGKSAWWGLGISVAAEMAFEIINNNSNILSDYKLVLLKNDSRVSKLSRKNATLDVENKFVKCRNK